MGGRWQARGVRIVRTVMVPTMVPMAVSRRALVVSACEMLVMFSETTRP